MGKRQQLKHKNKKIHVPAESSARWIYYLDKRNMRRRVSIAMQGDPIAYQESVSAGSFLEIRPPTGVAWALHTLIAGFDGAEVYLTDGTNSILIQSFSSVRYVTNLVHRVTHSVWIKMKNTDSSTRNLGYTGVETGLDGTNVGDAVLTMQVVDAADQLDIRPAAGKSVMLTNIYFDTNYILEFTGNSLTTEIAADDTSLPGDVPSRLDQTLEVTNDYFVRIINNDPIDPHPFAWSGYYIK